jgi:hypothetical protein
MFNYTARFRGRQRTGGGGGDRRILGPLGGSKGLILRLGLFRKDLGKGMDFNAFEHTVDGVGVFPGELLGFFE